MAEPTEYTGDTLHWSSNGHILFSFIQLDYAGGFVLGALFTIAICACERLLTLAFETRWAPGSIGRLRVANALWRAGLYWVLACYGCSQCVHAIAMSLNAGIILIAVTTLALGQLIIELWTPPRGGTRTTNTHPLGTPIPTYARSTTERGSVGPRRAPFQIGGDGGDSDSDS
ncbi:hypothetical protein K438DRAFT_1964584 [Mycena galopus ATCC 62051]|nr:hypothetical protein K438DRAFT_1964584 [Mycena galopus ATCC 62051]